MYIGNRKLDLGGTACFEDPEAIIISVDGSNASDEITPVVVGDYNDMPFPDYSFDEAVGSCYLEEKPNWHELFRVLRSDAKVVVKACNEGYATPRTIVRHARAAGFIVEHFSKPFEYLPGDMGYDDSLIFRKPKWLKWRINEALLQRLHRAFGPAVFYNEDAYWHYKKYHSQERSWVTDDGFMKMNVRNTLCAAAYKGRLIRLGVGKYQFPKESK